MSKYHAQPLTVDNIRFASTKEAHRYQELKLLERAGQIRAIKVQPEFELFAPVDYLDKKAFVGRYRADFSYEQYRDDTQYKGWQVVIEDVKGYKTPLYRWKKKHVEAQYGVQIVEV